MLNKIIIMGRLTRDPELKTTNNGKPVTKITLAVERDFGKDKEKETDFFDVVAWEKRAEFISKYFTKGQLVCVEGRLQRRQWEDDNCQKRYAFEILAESVYFAESKKNSERFVKSEALSDNDQGPGNDNMNMDFGGDFDPFADDLPY